jgi:hypothetical protein
MPTHACQWVTVPLMRSDSGSARRIRPPSRGHGSNGSPSGRGPASSLARVDNGGNHEPGNVGWTTPGGARPEQAPLGSRATR